MTQLDLFARRARPKPFSEDQLVAHLRRAEKPRSSTGLSRADIKRLMRPLPKITVPR